jgi:ABC-2 type transport system permease protein
MPRYPILVIAQNDLRVLRREPVPVVLMTIMPVVLMYIFRPVFANGAQQTVPGMTVLFAFFLVGHLGAVFFREHAWGTWQRLRASSASAADIMIGKSLVPLATFVAQFTILFSAGYWLFDLRPKGSILALALVALALALSLLAIGLLLVAICRSFTQLQTLVNLGSLALAGIGGALVPLYLLPSWVRTTAPATPGYWAMKGFTRTITEAGSVGSVIVPASILIAWAVALGGLAAVQMRLSDTKVTWS